MAVGHVGGVHVPGGGTAGDEALVVQGPHAEGQIPVDGAGGHVEGGGDDDELSAHVPHDPEEVGEADVEADGHADLAVGGVHHGEGIPGGEGVGLHEPLSAGHVDIKEVDLPVAGQLLALGGEDIAGVVDPALLQLGDGAADEVDAQLLGNARQELPALAPGGLAVEREAGVFIGTVEHLRQGDHVGPLGGGLADELPGVAEVLGLVSGHVHLAQTQFKHKQSSFLGR